MPLPRVAALRPLLALLALPGVALAQTERPTGDKTPDPATDPATGGDPQTRTVTLPEIFAQVRQAEPVRRAGLRADLLRRTQQTVPVVVIVSEARDYLAAVAAWEGPRRFPVLWDDGTRRGAEDIARFVRAFEPEKVVRFDAGAETQQWPRSRADREQVFRATLARASNERAADFDSVLAELRAAGVISPGVVLTDVDDNAWPAALALAAARYQPVGFVESPGPVTRPLEPAQADALEQAAQTLAASNGAAWRAIGDDVDAVTLCLNTGTKLVYGPGPRDVYATTARIGRFGDNGTGERWANAGQIFGSYAQSTYRAMCALFLTPADAFVFDGYEDTQPWVTYSGAEAAGVLKDAGMDVQLHDRPGNTTPQWLALSARPVRQGLWLINSHGSQAELNFPGGPVRGSNTPLMDAPVVAHVVHSFSLQSPWNRGTVGGGLLDRGAYAMLGSVDEPFLQSFMPTPMVARRLLAGLNFGAAVRFDDAPVWKLAVLGDPLITLGPPGTRTDDTALNLPGDTADLNTAMTDALGERDLATAVANLTLLGRDHDAARLASAVINDPEAKLSPELAAAAIPALFRETRHQEVVTAYANLTERDRSDPVLADCFWFAGRFLLGSSPDRERVERLMRIFPRPDFRVFDAEEMAMRLRPRSIEEAVLVLEALRPKLDRDWEIRALDQALERVRTGQP